MATFFVQCLLMRKSLCLLRYNTSLHRRTTLQPKSLLSGNTGIPISEFPDLPVTIIITFYSDFFSNTILFKMLQTKFVQFSDTTMRHVSLALNDEIDFIQFKNMKFACWMKLCHMKSSIDIETDIIQNFNYDSRFDLLRKRSRCTITLLFK